ncbi:MAG: aminoacyl-tRNA hydrolase [bacterium]|nr:aminoacyl-tRNA hydrolase [bacterium]
MEPLRINSRLVIPPDELAVSFARAGGPGGQNVNKVASKVVLRFALRGSRVLGEVRLARLEKALASRLTAAGELVIHASTYREQARNLEDARERLAELLRTSLAVPKARRETKPTRASRRRRVDTKRRRGQTKRDRRKPNSES